MLISFLAFKDQMERGKIEAKLFSDLSAKALSTRPKWKMVKENIFEHNNGEQIKIKKEDTLADVVLSVILIEMNKFIVNDSNSEKIFSLILDEFYKFFSLSDEEYEKITKKNKEFNTILCDVQMNKIGY